jgi:hypothetical protein
MFDCLSAFGHKKRADTFSESLAPGFVVFQHTKERLQPPIHHCLLMVDWVVSPPHQKCDYLKRENLLL